MLLSVVIPTWNRAHLVCDAIESALNQRPGEVEVIVVDDASTDNTIDVVTRIYGKRIRLLPLKDRSGAGAARNAGVALARGELVAFLDSDDVWLAGKLVAELRVLERFPDAEAVLSDSQNYFEQKADGASRFAQNGLLAATGGKIHWANDCDWLWTNSTNTVHTCSVTVLREALTRIRRPLFAEDLDCCEDWEFQMRVCHLCRVVVLPMVLAHVRRFDDNSRNGRGIPGRRTTTDQELTLLRDRLTVMKRAHWLKGLDPRLEAELARFQSETATRITKILSV
ncbi:MAG TPA: glycosyltransferase family A protein [Pyrinomonadaceae bacterium]|nr:glycosyltransferase family A protein [Pyrinomonadaceae bacterium]